MTTEREGVIKYQLVFKSSILVVDENKLEELNHCRGKLVQASLLGQDLARYDGLGFGNISFRALGEEALFYISSTQTGHLKTLDPRNLAGVTDTDIEQNTLFASGESRPSSEAMTHAVLYQLNRDINAVVHVHSPLIWRASDHLSLASTGADVPYGTPEMALAVQDLGRQHYIPGHSWVFVMKGHEDGVVAAGSSLSQCTEVLLALQENARQFSNKVSS